MEIEKVETPAAKRVMRFIDSYWEKHTMAPSLREISEGTGIGSLSHIHYLLDGLVKEGRLAARVFGTSRQVIPNWVVMAIQRGRGSHRREEHPPSERQEEGRPE